MRDPYPLKQSKMSLLKRPSKDQSILSHARFHATTSYSLIALTFETAATLKMTYNKSSLIETLFIT